MSENQQKIIYEVADCLHRSHLHLNQKQNRILDVQVENERIPFVCNQKGHNQHAV